MKLAALVSLVAHIPAASAHKLQLRIGIQHLAVREPGSASLFMLASISRSAKYRTRWASPPAMAIKSQKRKPMCFASAGP